MHVLLNVLIVTIGFNAISIYSEEDTYLDNQDSLDEYSSIDLMTVPKNSDVEEEEKLSTADRDDGIVDIDDIIKSSEFNTMFSPETTHVRRFAASLKDHISDEIMKPAKLDILSKTSSGDIERSVKEEKKSGKEQVKNDKKEFKIESKEDKKGTISDKSGEIINTNTKNIEKSANDENDSIPLTEADKKAPSEIAHELKSKSDESIVETTDSPRTSFVTADKFPDDMDDLIFPYFLDKIKKQYDDESYDRSQYSESPIPRSYEDSTPDASERDNIKPTRRMFESPAIPNSDDKSTGVKGMPNQNVIPDQLSSTPRPLTATSMPNNIQPFMPQNVHQMPASPPLPYMNNINSLNPALRSPQQPRLPNTLQLSLPFRRANSLYQPSAELKNAQNRFNTNRDVNTYPFVGPAPLPVTRNMVPNELNPIFRKLVEASKSPLRTPGLFDPSKIPIRSENFYSSPLDMQFPRPQNLNPYLTRYMY